MVFKAVKMIFSENYQHILPTPGAEFPAGSKNMGFRKKLSRDLKLPRPPKLNQLVPYVPTNRLTFGVWYYLSF